MNNTMRSRARGCLLGQLAGDTLGALVEFRHAEDIRLLYPKGLRDMAYNNHFYTIAGQPTDDSEMALLLARLLVKEGKYSQREALAQYQYWYSTDPFDIGHTISEALQGRPSAHSQANGALMRISPLGVFGSKYSLEQVAQWAMLDAEITHVHPICKQTNALYAMAIAYAIQSGASADEIYNHILSWAEEMQVAQELMKCILKSADSCPDANLYYETMGWVLVALGNALYYLLHATHVEEGVVETIMRGGDTDTNAAICGALLGSIYGEEQIPSAWKETLLQCRPQMGMSGVHTPRPECLWPSDVLELADLLIVDN